MKSKTTSKMKNLRKVLRKYKPVWYSLYRHPYPEQFSDQYNFPPYNSEPRLYLIATTPRCGSHLVGHALQTAEQFGFPLEYINQMNLNIWRSKLRAKTDLEAVSKLLQIRTSQSGWFGLKAHWNQYEPYEQNSFFDHFGGFEKVIWLYRRDLLAQSISRTIAEQTGQWISGANRRGEPVYDKAQISRNAHYIHNQNLNWYKYFSEKNNKPLMILAYEDILSNQLEAFTKICNFLDPSKEIELSAPEKTRKQSNQTSKEWYQRFATDISPSDEWILKPQKFEL